MADNSEFVCDHLWVDLREVLDACPDPIQDILETKSLTVVDSSRPGIVVIETEEKDRYEITISVKKLE